MSWVTKGEDEDMPESHFILYTSCLSAAVGGEERGPGRSRLGVVLCATYLYRRAGRRPDVLSECGAPALTLLLWSVTNAHGWGGIWDGRGEGGVWKRAGKGEAIPVGGGRWEGE